MQGFNDANCRIDENGDITTGLGGLSDGAANATYKYAKNDVTFTVPGFLLSSDTQPAMTYITGDIAQRTLAASTTHKVAIPFTAHFNRSTQNPTSGFGPLGASGTAAKGILIKNLALFYRVNTTTITSFTTMAINYMTMAAGAALPTVTALTTTLAGNTLTAAANVYAGVSTVTTPIWLPTDDLNVWAVATIVVPGSSTVDLLGASWRCALAIF